jgi:hypothetical protein
MDLYRRMCDAKQAWAYKGVKRLDRRRSSVDPQASGLKPQANPAQ